MYKMPLYLIISCGAQTLMLLPILFIAFKPKKHIVLKTLLFLAISTVANYAASAYDVTTNSSTFWISILFHISLFVFITIMFESKLGERVLFTLVNSFACFSAGLFGVLPLNLFRLQSTDIYGSIIVSIFIAIFYWTEMGIYISFKNKSKLYNSKLILILIPNIGWQLIINYLLINFFFETKVALNHTDMRDIFKGDSLGIVAFLTVIIAIIDIATVIFINNLNKSIFLDEQIDNTKVKSKTIEIYKGESNELSNNIRLLSESLNKTIHTFKQSSNIDCIELNKAINDFNNIKANQYSENSLIEAICVEKLGKLQESINITTQINIPQNISINDLDLCRIFCNLLDNALEAIHNSNQKKYLNIYAEYVDNKFTCLVENPSNSNLNKKNIISKRHQGLGLIILKDIAKKYNGKLTTKTYNGTFHTLIELILIEHPKTILLTE